MHTRYASSGHTRLLQLYATSTRVIRYRTRITNSNAIFFIPIVIPAGYILQGGSTSKGYLVTQTTETLSILNFSTRFFTQIVESPGATF